MAMLLSSSAFTLASINTPRSGVRSSVSRAQPAQRANVSTRRGATLVVKAAADGGQGFSKNKTGAKDYKKSSGGPTKGTGIRGLPTKGTGVGTGWEDSGFKFQEMPDNKGKPFISKIAANNLAYCVFKIGNSVYATEANSTAYEYPLVDAEIIQADDGIQLKVPLDGTIYKLTTGEVIVWCPQDTMMRKFLGGLKKQVAPIPLKVFETKLGAKGEVIVKLSPKNA